MIKETDIARFNAKITVTEYCWIWNGSIQTSGYGNFWFVDRKIGAHRFSYEMRNGEFDKSLYVLHKCDNKKCVNPDHLFLGTQKDNMQDFVNKGFKRKTPVWKNGHPNLGKTTSDFQKINMSKIKQKHFEIISPTGELIKGVNLTRFCKENGLSQGGLWHVINGTCASHRGYTKPT